MADIQVDLGHGRNAGASTKGDATLATLLVVVPAVFQQKTAYSLQNRRSAEVAQRRAKPQGPRGDESPTPGSQGSLRRWLGVAAGIADPACERNRPTTRTGDHKLAAVSDTRLQRDIVHSRPLGYSRAPPFVLLLDVFVSITRTRMKDEDDLVAVP